MKNRNGQSLLETILILMVLGSLSLTALGLIGSMVSERWLSKLAYDYLDCLNLKGPKALCFQTASSRARTVLPLIITKIEVQKTETGNRSLIRALLLNKKVVGHGFFPKENFRKTSAGF